MIICGETKLALLRRFSGAIVAARYIYNESKTLISPTLKFLQKIRAEHENKPFLSGTYCSCIQFSENTITTLLNKKQTDLSYNIHVYQYVINSIKVDNVNVQNFLKKKKVTQTGYVWKWILFTRFRFTPVQWTLCQGAYIHHVCCSVGSFAYKDQTKSSKGGITLSAVHICMTIEFCTFMRIASEHFSLSFLKKFDFLKTIINKIENFNNKITIMLWSRSRKTVLNNISTTAYSPSNSENRFKDNGVSLKHLSTSLITRINVCRKA